MKIAGDGVEGAAGQAAGAAVRQVPTEVNEPFVLQRAQVALGQFHRLTLAAEIQPCQFGRGAGRREVDDLRLELLLRPPGELEQLDQDLPLALREVVLQHMARPFPVQVADALPSPSDLGHARTVPPPPPAPPSPPPPPRYTGLEGSCT